MSLGRQIHIPDKIHFTFPINQISPITKETNEIIPIYSSIYPILEFSIFHYYYYNDKKIAVIKIYCVHGTGTGGKRERGKAGQ